MKRLTLVYAIASACAIAALAGCEPPEKLAGPPSPSKAVICTDDYCADPDPSPGGVVGRFGLVIHNNATSAEVDALSALHVNLVRLNVDWGHERIQPTWAPAQMDALHGRGIDILANVQYRYSYESPGTGGDFAPCAQRPQLACVPTGAAWDTLYRDWVTYVKQLVDSNHTSVKYWATWNEPNDSAFFTGRPAQYDSLARALCDAVQATRQATGDQQLYCVGPDLAIHRPFQTGTAGNDWTWLQGRMSAVNFDIISIHWYEWLDDVKAKTNYVKSQYPGKPVWVTETAMPDPTYRLAAADPEFQEEDLVAKWEDLHSGSGPMDALFYYDLQSVENGITQDFNPRPAYYALKRLNEGTYVHPLSGNCSTETGNDLCAYTSWIPPQHGCRTDYYVRNRYGQPVKGATILAKWRTQAPWYERLADLGYRTTNAAGVASFTARCGWLQSAHFVAGGSLTSPTDSPEMLVDENNRVAVYTFNVW